MKKLIVVVLMLALLLCAGCTGEEAVPVETIPETTVPETTVPETTVPETTEETIPVPEVVMGISDVDKLPAILMRLSRGDTVDVTGEYDEHYYVIKTEQGYGLVEKELIRFDTEPAYEIWTGYCRYNSKLHDDFRLSGEPLQTMRTNTKVEVQADLGWCYLVAWEDQTGYIASESISDKPIRSGGGGGGGGGSADGGDISLQVSCGIRLLAMVPQEGEVTGQAQVLADGTEVILGTYDRGEEIPIVAEEGFADSWEGYHTVYLNGLYAYVSEEMVRTEEEAAYEEWDGFSKYNTPLCEDIWMLREPLQMLRTNTKVHVLCELEHCYLVEVDGVRGYAPREMVQKNRITGGGGGGGGGSEWSPPAL